MKKEYVLVPPKGIRLDLNAIESELSFAQEKSTFQEGPEYCQIEGRIYNTVDPAESAIAEGDCLSRIHHPMTPSWVRRASQIIFAPVLFLTVVKMVISLFTMSLPNSFSELVIIILIFSLGLMVIWGYWVIFVSGPGKST
ncbi:hypothetical protein [Vibrio porteresiae]|uniref:Uncharacterized protein n=1 Tax=Vibrio porteresiae DSM 19223 TaxID=1123496 RepID=A0ABZ0QHE3_9VIBR|nr:hypothetical protein [Vibrio porteresiae]WPC75927.1 hypothetical protein R8Z52_23730 [Vibrio porteresiae DSM 19223]